MIYYEQISNTKNFVMLVYLTIILKCSINGDNKSFGMPTNPVALDRIPGGSSSGSAVAVAAGFVDFALGEDFKLLLEKN